MSTRLAEPLQSRMLEDLERLLRSSVSDQPLPVVASGPLATYPWHEEKHKQHAEEAMEQTAHSLQRRDTQMGLESWRRVVAAVQADQISYARHASKQHRLQLSPVGSGPLIDRPLRYRERRADWRIYPADARHGIRLPEKARRVKETWESVGSPFASYYLADEMPSEEGVLTRMASHKVGTVAAAVAVAGVEAARGLATALIAPLGAIASLAMLDPILIGVISTDGVTGDWYALERWNH